MRRLSLSDDEHTLLLDTLRRQHRQTLRPELADLARTIAAAPSVVAGRGRGIDHGAMTSLRRPGRDMTTTRDEVERRLSDQETPGDIAAAMGLAYDASDDVVILPGWRADDGGAEVEYPGAVSADAAAHTYVHAGDWHVQARTIWIDVRVWQVGLRLDDDGVTEVEVHSESRKISIDPSVPRCHGADRHTWGAEVIRGHGGGVIGQSTCADCGLARTHDSWAQDPRDGTQGLSSVSYDWPDEGPE